MSNIIILFLREKERRKEEFWLMNVLLYIDKSDSCWTKYKQKFEILASKDKTSKYTVKLLQFVVISRNATGDRKVSLTNIKK